MSFSVYSPWERPSIKRTHCSGVALGAPTRIVESAVIVIDAYQNSSDPGAPMQPLAGITILDLTRLLPGGFCTLILADLGADVLKVEEPGRGDYLRAFPPLGATQSVLFTALNRGKRSMTLNLKREEGRALLLELARRADVLVESYRPGVLARL